MMFVTGDSQVQVKGENFNVNHTNNGKPRKKGKSKNGYSLDDGPSEKTAYPMG